MCVKNVKNVPILLQEISSVQVCLDGMPLGKAEANVAKMIKFHSNGN